MSRRQFRTWSVVAVTCAACMVTAVFGQGNDAGRATGGRGGRGGRAGDALVPTALLSGRNLKPSDFPTMRSTTGDVYVWQDVHTLGFLTNNLIVITPDGVLVADGQNSPEATKRMVDAIGLLTPQPIKYVVVCSEHGDHTGGNEAFPSTATVHLEPGLPGQPRPASQGPEHQRPENDRPHSHGSRSARAEDG